MHEQCRFLYTLLDNFYLKVCVKDMTDYTLKRQTQQGKEFLLFCIYSCPTSHIFLTFQERNLKIIFNSPLYFMIFSIQLHNI